MKNIKTICLAAAVSALVFGSCKTKHEKRRRRLSRKNRKLLLCRLPIGHKCLTAI